MRSFIEETFGGVGIMAGIIIPVVFAAGGGAIDYSNAMRERASLQSALDQSAIAVGLSEGEDKQRKEAGVASLRTNFARSCGEEPAYEITGDEIRGSMTCNIGTYILGIVGVDTIPISVSTVIGFGNGGTASNLRAATCVYILDPSHRASLDKGGGGDFLAPTCGIYVNSNNRTAVSVGGGSIDVSHINVVGGVNSSCESWRCKATPLTGVAPITDPMAGFTPPSSEACTHTNYDDTQAGNRTASPGVYCGGMNFAAGNTHFSPGVYTIRDGLLQQGGGGNWTGDGVVFRFEGTGRLSRGGGGDISFTAPTSGPYAGIAFLQTASSSPGLRHEFGGGGNSKLEGLIYLPDHDIDFGGGGDRVGAAPWTIWVVRRLELGGGGDIFIGADFETSNVPLPEAFEASASSKRRLVIRK